MVHFKCSRRERCDPIRWRLRSVYSVCSVFVFVIVCAFVPVWVFSGSQRLCVCVRACVCACVRACVCRVCVCVSRVCVHRMCVKQHCKRVGSSTSRFVQIIRAWPAKYSGLTRIESHDMWKFKLDDMVYAAVFLWATPPFIDSVSSHKVAYAWIEMCFAALELRSAMPIAWIVAGLMTTVGVPQFYWSRSVGYPGQQ